MPTQEPPEASDPNHFICDCEEHMRQACAGEGFYEEKEGKRYCVLHYPGDEKAADFKTVLDKKQSAHDYNFRGVWFPKGVRFKELHWDENTDFSSASFNEYIDFSGVEFKVKALFNNASFNAGVDFSRVNFTADADFSEATFSARADFSSAIFSGDADFLMATFSLVANFREANFSSAAFFIFVTFRADASFREATFSAGSLFTNSTFSENADFNYATFSENADFNDATFSAVASFREATFSARADFTSASFSADAYFIIASFSENASFRNASFNADASFRDASFGENADFRDAIFRADALFGNASFSADADFNLANFSGNADFNNARFNGNADFNNASFSADANFISASFSADANFRYASFSTVANFRSARFKDYFYFAKERPKRRIGVQQRLNFQFAHFEKPDRVSFHTLDLKPHWFVNVDSRKFEFIDVEFNYDLKDELERLKKADVSAPHRLLAIACRQLAVNAEENHRYREAANLRYASMDAKRQEWLQKRKIKTSYFLHWLYWMASGYGESVKRAIFALVMLWLLFALSYTVVGFEHKTAKPSGNQSAIATQEDEVGKPLPFKKVFTYSLSVMSLQKPDPKPVTIAAQTLVIFETILCPIQAALLALAIRRRFMR